MKNWKKIAVLGVVLVAFVIAFIFLKNNQDKLGDAESTASPAASDSSDQLKLVDIEKDKITKLTLKRDTGDIVLNLEEKEVEKLETKDDGTTQKVTEKANVWVSPDFDADNDTVSGIVSSASSATTARLIEENPKDLSIYGLDKPLVITFATSDGKEASIEMGNKTPTGDSYYVRQAGNATVYTLGATEGEKFCYGKMDLMSKNLYKSNVLTQADLSSMAFTKDGKKVFESKLVNKDWVITYPLSFKADTDDLSKFLTWAVDFRASGFVAENPADLKQYGLDKPSYVFDYTLGGKQYVLRVGAKTDDKYYGQLEGNPDIFTLDSSALTFVDIPAIDMMQTFVYLPSIFDVEKLTIEMDGRVDELLIDTVDDKNYDSKYYLNGKKIEGDDNITLYKKYYQGAIGITGDKIDTDAKPSGKPYAKLTYTRKKADPDKVVTVELIPTPDEYGYYLMKNGQYTGLVMGTRQLDEADSGIRWHYKNLMDALSKTP